MRTQICDTSLIRVIRVINLMWLLQIRGRLASQAMENLQAIYRKSCVSRHYSCPDKGPSKTPRISQHYGMEGFKGAPSFGPHHAEGREPHLTYPSLSSGSEARALSFCWHTRCKGNYRPISILSFVYSNLISNNDISSQFSLCHTFGIIIKV